MMDSSATQPANQVQPKLDPSTPSESIPVSYGPEKTVLDVYNNLSRAAEHRDLERIRNSVAKARLNELKRDNIDLLDAVTTDITFQDVKVVKEIERKHRALLLFSGTSQVITDNQGNPATATGIYQFVREDNRWKLRLLMWHIHPPTDPVPEAIRWLDQKGSNP